MSKEIKPLYFNNSLKKRELIEKSIDLLNELIFSENSKYSEALELKNKYAHIADLDMLSGGYFKVLTEFKFDLMEFSKNNIKSFKKEEVKDKILTFLGSACIKIRKGVEENKEVQELYELGLQTANLSLGLESILVDYINLITGIEKVEIDWWLYEHTINNKRYYIVKEKGEERRVVVDNIKDFFDFHIKDK